jgi:amidohydrolase
MLFAVAASAILVGSVPGHAQPSASSSWRVPATADVDAIYADLERLYIDLHQHPELGFQETRTSAALAARLTSLGFEVTTGVGRTGVVGVLRNGPGPTVMLRTEMDALPVEEKTGLPFASHEISKSANGTTTPVMHACGHDLHMAAWTGTATLMAQNRSRWSGTLLMVGQPAEEGGRGASAMLKDGLFTRFPRPDFALSFHDDDTLASGVVGYHPGLFRSMSDGVTITVYGRGGHGAMPNNTVDPVVLASKIVLSLQTLVSRESNPVDPVVVTVGSIHGGTAGNVIPDEVRLQLSVRTNSQETRQHTLEAIRRVARGEAMASNAPREPKVDAIATAASPVFNDPAATARLAAALTTQLGAAGVTPMPQKMTSEDFAEYGVAGVPSVLLHIGAVSQVKLDEAKRTGIPVPAPHSPAWAPDLEPTLKAAVRAETAAILELLSTK